MPVKARAASPPPELLHVRVTPRARRNEVVGWQGPALQVRVTAAPADGEANRAVTRLLADAFEIPPSRVALVRGVTARDKIFRVGGLSVAALRARIEARLAPLARKGAPGPGTPR